MLATGSPTGRTATVRTLGSALQSGTVDGIAAHDELAETAVVRCDAPQIDAIDRSRGAYFQQVDLKCTGITVRGESQEGVVISAADPIRVAQKGVKPPG